MEATAIWEANEIAPCPRNALPVTATVLEEPFVAHEQSAVRSHYCGYRKREGRQFCTCSDFAATGKRCAGLWALAILQTTGQVNEFEQECVRMRPRKSRTLAESEKEDAVAPNEDEDDLVAYWGNNPIDDPIKALLNTRLDTAANITPEEDLTTKQHSSKSPVTPSSMRQTRQRAKQKQTAPHVDSQEPASVSNRGRLAKIQPHDRTRQPRRSTLGMPTIHRFPDERPIGFVNLGTDCYALSLFNVLARQPEWQRCFDTFNSQRTDSSAVVRLYQQFIQAMLQRKATAFPDLNQVLKGTYRLTCSVQVGVQSR